MMDLHERLEILEAVVAEQQKTIERLAVCVQRLSWPHSIQAAPSNVPALDPLPVSDLGQRLRDAAKKLRERAELARSIENSTNPRVKLGT